MTGRGVADIAPARLDELNSGRVQAATLTECLAVDFAALMRAALPDLGGDAVHVMAQAKSEGISRRMAVAARLVMDHRGMDAVRDLQNHPSDTVRGWVCFVIGQASDMSLSARLQMLRPLADDAHFGVREWAWMAVRGHISDNLGDAIRLLSTWSTDPSERLRRFTTEATRPRGVWCAHIGALRQAPEQALPLLEPLRADPARYVQDSVGNWLNDASKDRPDWVRDLCAEWLGSTSAPATAYICKRALRSVQKVAQKPV